jgi:TolB-like protein/DNA-binding SARP family transcriptional activator/Flp pilus assembly protein TadD
MVRLRTLGGAALLRDDGTPHDGIGAQRKLLALLAVLAHAGRMGISRDRIASYLWSESDIERARGALKQSLHVLRRQFGTADVVLGTTELRLNPELIEADVAQFLEAVEGRDATRAVELYGGPFLDGFHLTGSAAFEEWAEEQRSVLARHHARSVEGLADAAQQRGAHGEAAALWRRLQAQDPFSARAIMGLMEALAATGERAAALRAGNAYETLLREELGAVPAAGVATLMEHLRSPDPVVPPTPASELTTPPLPAMTDDSGDADSTAPVASGADVFSDAAVRYEPAPVNRGPRRWAVRIATGAMLIALAAMAWWQFARTERGTTAAAAAPSLAVIPFVNTSDDAADAHFADGLTDELISRLGRVEGVRVSARTSTFALKDRGLSARAFADALGVSMVIEGTVRRQAERLKITAQLVDPKDNSVLWSESYDRLVQDVIAVQEEIALAIVGALQTRFPGQTAAPVRVAVPQVDPEAYDLYLRGRYNWHLPTRERLAQGIRYYQVVVERDPMFAPAFAALAETYVNMAIYAQMPSEEALARARVAADRALALDAGLVEALAARAYVRLSGLEFDGAEADLRDALAANPNYPWTHHFLSLYRLMTGRSGEAEAHNRQALLLDPLSLPANATRGVVLTQLGDLAQAERELTRALRLRSDFTITLYYLGAVQAARGNDHAALASLEQAAREAPDYPGVPGARALVLRRLGRDAAADSIMTLLSGRAGSDARAQVNLAFALGAAGNLDAATGLLKGVLWDVPSLIGLRADPLLAGLRADPRCVRIMERIGAQR